ILRGPERSGKVRRGPDVRPSQAGAAGTASIVAEGGMVLRACVAAIVLVAGLAASPGAQGIYREPFHDSRAVAVVEAEPAPPVELDRARLTLNPVSSTVALNILARQRGRAGVPPGAIVLMIAFGSDGSMRSYSL